MVIGISGLAGSGKDTAASLLRILKKHPELTDYEVIQFHKNNVDINSDFRIKHFATNVKYMVSIITGIPMKDIDNNKDTVVDDLLRPNGYACDFNVRNLLQFVGTDLFRSQYDIDIWINILFKNYIEKSSVIFEYNNMIWKPISKMVYSAESDNGKIHLSLNELNNLNSEKIILKESNWIIPDVRFDNEAEHINKYGFNILIVNNRVTQGTHISEQGIKAKYIKHIIYNNKDLEYLTKQLRKVL